MNCKIGKKYEEITTLPFWANYLHEEKELFSWKEIFIFTTKNIYFHENNLEKGLKVEVKKGWNIPSSIM